MIDVLVSIIIPIYNSEKYIGRCLESLINQTYRNIELVLVNDGSKDASESLIQKYLSMDKRIKLYNQENQGPSVARNTGLIKVRGKYITFVDADDYVDKNMIKEMVNCVKDTNSLIFCDNSEIWNNKTDQRKIFQGYENKLSKEVVIKEIASGSAGLVCGKLFSKEIVDKYNIKFDTNINMCEDQIFFLNVANYCNSFIHIPKTLYFYDRCNENSITIRYQNKAIENQIYVLNKLEEILFKCNLNKEDIKHIINNRFMGSIIYCINNEVMDTRIYNINKKIDNIKKILKNDSFNLVIKQREPQSFREKIITSSFKKSSHISMHFAFYILDKIIHPVKISLKKVVKR